MKKTLRITRIQEITLNSSMSANSLPDRFVLQNQLSIASVSWLVSFLETGPPALYNIYRRALGCTYVYELRGTYRVAG